MIDSKTHKGAFEIVDNNVVSIGGGDESKGLNKHEEPQLST